MTTQELNPPLPSTDVEIVGELGQFRAVTLPMTEDERRAKLAELDGFIASLQDELAETPDRLWAHDRSRYRLETLIRYQARRHMLSL